MGRKNANRNKDSMLKSLRVEPFRWPKCEHIEGSTNFSLQTQFLQFFWNFQKQNPLKNQYLPHLGSETCEINSVKSDSPRAFLEHQERPQISIQFSFPILFSFN